MSMIFLSLVFLIFSMLAMKYKTKRKIIVFLESTLLVLFGVVTLIYVSSNYFTGEGVNHTVLSAVRLGLGSAGFQEYTALILLSLLALAFIFAGAFFYYKHLTKVEIQSPDKIKALIHNVFFILAFSIHPFFKDVLHLYDDINLEQSNDFYQYYVEPTIKSSGNDKNLVYIYLESFEKTYLDNELFPRLAPNLNKLILEKGIEFTNIHQVSGADYTIAGMTSTQCGIPLFAPYHGNSMSGIDKFYPKAKCIGDILKDSGYYLSFMQGSSTHFSGIDKFYQTHGFDRIQGREELMPHLQDSTYTNGWGLYDDTLLDLVFEEFIELSEKQDKFALFTITLDTHHPDGHLSNSCKDELYGDGNNRILNTFKCSDALVAKFIQKIQQSKYADNTVVVIGSDHLAMRNTASDMMPSGNNRRNLFVIFDGEVSDYESIDRNGTSFDVAPTLLSKLDINANLGLGRNLFESDSLFDHFQNFNQKLASWRDEVLSFWKFAKLTDVVRIDFSSSKMMIGNQSISFPVLIKIDKATKQIHPFFQEGVPEKLYEQFLRLDSEDYFLWVDKCIYQNYLFSKAISEDSQYCMVQGVYGKTLDIQVLKNIEAYRIKDFASLESSFVSLNKLRDKINEIKNIGTIYHSTLEDGIIFNKEGYPNFLYNVKGMSNPESWGRWSDANLYEYVEFEFKENLPQHFELELEIGGYGPNAGQDARVIIGENEQKIRLVHSSSSKYVLQFEDIKNAKVIKIIPPLPTSPASLRQSADERKLGISFISLKVANRNNDDISGVDYKLADKLIAHAGGAIDGVMYTNTLEALNESYKKGFRIFELDLIQTSDGHFVASHDWNTWREQSGFNGVLPPNLIEFKKYKILGKYTSLDMDDINRWFDYHKDAILVTDKVNAPKVFSTRFIDNKRLIMELFTWDAVEEALDNNIQAMPTWGIVEQIKGDKTKYLLEKNIKHVAASRNILSDRYFELHEMKKSGIKVYAFHVNHKKGYDEAYMLCHEFDYFYGMYADNWDFRRVFNNSKCNESVALKPLIGYPSTLEDGIVFNKEGYPEFLSNVKGISNLEGWGRWSDANIYEHVEFEFNEDLPQHFELELEMGAFGPNVGQYARVLIGDKEQELKLIQSNPEKYVLQFDDVKNTRIIKIIPPLPTSPASLQRSGDERKLGISFTGLRINTGKH